MQGQGSDQYEAQGWGEPEGWGKADPLQAQFQFGGQPPKSTSFKPDSMKSDPRRGGMGLLWLFE